MCLLLLHVRKELMIKILCLLRYVIHDYVMELALVKSFQVSQLPSYFDWQGWLLLWWHQVTPGREKLKKLYGLSCQAGDFLSGSVPSEGQRCEEINLLLTGLQSCHKTLGIVPRAGGHLLSGASVPLCSWGELTGCISSVLVMPSQKLRRVCRVGSDRRLLSQWFAGLTCLLMQPGGHELFLFFLHSFPAAPNLQHVCVALSWKSLEKFA